MSPTTKMIRFQHPGANSPHITSSQEKDPTKGTDPGSHIQTHAPPFKKKRNHTAMHHKNALTHHSKNGENRNPQRESAPESAPSGQEGRDKKQESGHRMAKTRRPGSSTSSHSVGVVVVRLGCARPAASLMADEMSGEVTGKSMKGSWRVRFAFLRDAGSSIMTSRLCRRYRCGCDADAMSHTLAAKIHSRCGSCGIVLSGHKFSLAFSFLELAFSLALPAFSFSIPVFPEHFFPRPGFFL